MQVDSLPFQEERLGDKKEFAKLKKICAFFRISIVDQQGVVLQHVDRRPTLFSDGRPISFSFRPVDVFAFASNLFSSAGLL